MINFFAGGVSWFVFFFVTKPTQLKSWVCHKNDFTPPPPTITTTHHHPPQTQCHQYLSCSWPNFNRTLNLGFVGSTTTTNNNNILHTKFYLPSMFRSGLKISDGGVWWWWWGELAGGGPDKVQGSFYSQAEQKHQLPELLMFPLPSTSYSRKASL